MRKSGLCTQNTPLRIRVHISFADKIIIKMHEILYEMLLEMVGITVDLMIIFISKVIKF